MRKLKLEVISILRKKRVGEVRGEVPAPVPAFPSGLVTCVQRASRVKRRESKEEGFTTVNEKQTIRISAS